VAGAPLVAVALALLAGAGSVGVAVAAAAGAALAVPITVRTVLAPMAHRSVDAHLAGADARADLDALRRAVTIRDRFDDAVAAEGAEAAVLRLLVTAALEVTPDADVSLLLSLPDEPRVAWSVRSAGDRLLPAEPVPGRPSCVALATGRTAVAPSSTEMGACGHLRDPGEDVHDLDGVHDPGDGHDFDDGGEPGDGDGVESAAEEPSWEPTEVAALCLPLVIGERNLGVLCVTTAPGELPDRDRQATLEHVVHVGSARLESLRQRRGPSTPGPTDPVTGLPTEVALRARAGELTRSHQPWCLAVLRIDGADEFRNLHGPRTWDDAMRLIADTTSTTLRPDDVVVRLDGERVAAVLSGCSTAHAAAALERARESLVLAHTMAGIEHFTCSVGLVDGTRTTSIDDGIRLADAAGHAALLQGGNRVVVADASIT